jgi:hypothetical protein
MNDGPQEGDRRLLKSRRIYLEALERLKLGTPRNTKLQEALTTGKGYTISPSTVALEAGKSRNPLYTTHKDVLERIAISAIPATAPARTIKRVGSKQDRMKELLETIEVLKAEKAMLATQNLALLVRAAKAEEKLNESRDTAERKMARQQNRRMPS